VKVLDLFSGIGGFSLGLEGAGMETIAFCEIEDFPRRVLAKHWPNIPIARDVKKLTYKDGVLYDDGAEIYRGTIDVICGGFPCQDISGAGNQAGIGEGTRSGLWSECARLVGEIRPKFAVFENVSALLSGNGGDWFKRVLWDISTVGYDAEWHCIPASYVGACHRRDRVWIIAYPGGTASKAGLQKQIFGQSDLQKKPSRVFEIIGERPDPSQSLFFRKDDGIPMRTHRDRIKSLGNAVVPQIPEIIGRAIITNQTRTGAGE